MHHDIRDELGKAFTRVLDSGWFIMGPELEAFENEFAAYCGVKHCIGVGNGLEALHLLLRAYEIGVGDEVIVPSNTFIATWLAVTQCGATPVPVEPNPLTHNIEAAAIARAITQKTKAIMPVHLYGQPADMDPINALAKENGLFVIEDAAQAQGAKYKGKMAGSLGHAAGTSFYPGKNLGALGDGGAVLTSDDAIAEKVKRLRNYGSQVKYQHEIAGFNSRLDELQAAFLRIKLGFLDACNTRRKAVAKQYTELFANTELGLPVVPSYADPVWHQYVVRSARRNELQSYLQKNGIATVIHYPTPPHKQTCYKDYFNISLPLADQLASEVLSLPISPVLDEAQIRHIVNAILAFEC